MVIYKHAHAKIYFPALKKKFIYIYIFSAVVCYSKWIKLYMLLPWHCNHSENPLYRNKYAKK